MINTIKTRMWFFAMVGVALLAAACSTGSSTTATSAVKGHGSKAVVGVVTAVGKSRLTIESHGTTKSIALESSTKYTKGHTGATLSDLAIGERVRVHLVPGASAATASKVVILLPSLVGTVSALTTTGFTLTTGTGVAHTVTTSSTTSYRLGRSPTGVSSLQVGDKVRAIGVLGPSGSMVASAVTIHG
ncbi:MAG: DUF5666 domain-containing protein [Acidimicrobiales bacterium]